MEETFDFDQLPDPHGQWSLKWDRHGGRDVIPLWVADMDFRCAPAVLRILRERVEHGIFGYVEPGPELLDAIAGRLSAQHGWTPQREWFVWLPGLVSGLNVACRAVGEAGDAVATAVPVYPPFLSAPGYSDRELVRVPLRQEGERWRFDPADLEAALTPRTRLLLLCNPHNPVGRAWTRAELAAIAAVCERHDIIVCSDEVHCGLILEPGVEHVPLATLSPEISRRSITLMAASKTFNLPALGAAFAIVPDASLRARLRRVMAGIVHRPGGLGLWATLAAYRDGEPWRLALLHYLRANRDHVLARLNALPGLRAGPVEATYLAWIDCRGAGLESPARFFEAAGVGLYEGSDFGAPGWARLNFATGRALLDEAIDRMASALAASAPGR
jgi:cystathionine beta-lyase